MFRFGRSPQPLHAPVALRGAEAIAEHRRQFPDETLDLHGADLSGVVLVGADLSGADLRGATLDGARLDGANLHDARLREASLRDCTLTGAHGLIAGQLAGTDLTGAVLPENIHVERLEEAARCGDSADYARTIYMWMVGGCAFVWLMLISTTQLQLLTNDGVVKLPVFDVDAPSELFFLLGPFLVIGVYSYLHVYLQRIWEVLGGLPAVFPDGEPIDRKTHGWMVLGLVRWQWRRLRERPRMFFSQTLLSVLLAWGLAPLTVYSVWRRCAIRHDWNQSIIQAIACACVAHVAVGSLLAARGAFTLRRNTLAHAGQWAISLIILYGMHGVMQSTIKGRAELGWFNARVVHYHPADRTPKWGRTKRELENEYLDAAPFLAAGFRGQRDPEFTVEAAAALDDLGRRWREAYAEFSGPLLRGAHLEGCFVDQSDLSSADLSGSQWNRATLLYSDLTQANLQGADFQQVSFNAARLVGVSAQGASFADAWAYDLVALGGDFTGGNFERFRSGGPLDLRKTALDGANLKFAQLPKARLQGASLKDADLRGANLAHADLSGADLSGANLKDADLRGACLKGADLSGADLTGARFGEQTLKYNGQRASLVTQLDGAVLAGVTGLTESMIAAATNNDDDWSAEPAAIAAADASILHELRVAQAPPQDAPPSHLLFAPPTEPRQDAAPLRASLPTVDFSEVDYTPATPGREWPSEAWPE